MQIERMVKNVLPFIFCFADILCNNSFQRSLHVHHGLELIWKTFLTHKLFTHHRWRSEFALHFLDEFIPFTEAEIATAREPACMLSPWVVVWFPVTQTSVTEETFHVVGDSCKSRRIQVLKLN